MIASFSKHIFKGKHQKKTKFVEKIANPQQQKIHTIRMGSRWRPGLPFQAWDGSPRANKKEKIYSTPFNPIISTCPWWMKLEDRTVVHKSNFSDQAGYLPPLIWSPVVTAVEEIHMTIHEERNYFDIHITIGNVSYFGRVNYNRDALFPIFEDKTVHYGYNAGMKQLSVLTYADGFDCPEDFFFYFRDQARRYKTQVLEGQIIHWTPAAKACYDFMNADQVKIEELAEKYVEQV